MAIPIIGDILGSVIGGIGGIFGTAMGASQSAAASQAANKLYSDRMTEITNEYNKDYYQDYLQRSDVKSTLTKLKEERDRQSKMNKSAAAVMGATPEAVAAAKQAEGQNFSTAMGNITSNADSFKTRVKELYNAQRDGLDAQKFNMLQAQQQAAANLMGQGIQTIGSAASGIGSALTKKK